MTFPYHLRCFEIARTSDSASCSVSVVSDEEILPLSTLGSGWCTHTEALVLLSIPVSSDLGLMGLCLLSLSLEDWGISWMLPIFGGIECLCVSLAASQQAAEVDQNTLFPAASGL